MSTTKLADFLKEKLIAETTVVTVKSLSRELDLDISEAKRLLTEFHQSHAGRGDYKDLAAFVQLTGVIIRPDGIKESKTYSIAWDEMDKIKKTFTKFVSQSVYALKMNPIDNPLVVFNVDQDPQHRWLKDDIRHGCVQLIRSALKDPTASHVIDKPLRTEKTVKEQSAEPNTLRKSDVKPVKASKGKNAFDKMFGAGRKTEASVAASSQESAVSSQESMVASESCSQRTDNDEASPKESSKLPTVKKLKTKKKRQVASDSEDGTMEVDEGDDLSRETSPLPVKRRGRLQAEKKNVQSQHLSETHSDIFSVGLSSPESSPVKRTSPRKREKVAKETSPVIKSTKRKRKPSAVVDGSDEKDNSSSDEFVKVDKKKTAVTKDKVEKKRSKKAASKTDESDVVSDDFVEQPHKPLVKVTGGKGIKGRLVPKEFQDEDGYLVTQKVWEEVENSDDNVTDTNKKATEKEIPKKVSPEVAKTKSAPVKKMGSFNSSQQPSLTSYFKKK